MQSASRYIQIRWIAILGGIKNAVLAVLKIIFGTMGHSHALFADGIHSLSDLLIDGLVLIASRFGSKAADSDHPYGHGRIETAATLLLALILALAGLGIIYDAAQEVMGVRAAVRPSFYVFWIAFFSMVINEVMYFYTRRIGERVHSQLLVTNAWHHRSDSASSLVVLLGVVGVWLGFERLDAVAAGIVGFLVIKMAWEFGWSSIRELVDTGMDEETLSRIKTEIASVSGVRAIHQLRTRSVGGAIFGDVHVLVDPSISVSEGHFIGEEVHFRLLEKIPGITDVTVHVDPEDDELAPPSFNLPSRAELISLVKERWQGLPALMHVDAMILHYLGGRVHIELCLPLALVGSQTKAEELVVQLQAAVADVDKIGSVKVYFKA